MNHCPQSPHAQVAQNHLPEIGVRIALAQTCGVMHAASLLTQIFHSIVFRRGMDASLRSPIFLPNTSHLTFVIILMIVLPF
jgi:hypothetical protein